MRDHVQHDLENIAVDFPEHEVFSLLGKGGFGEVYHCRELEGLQREVDTSNPSGAGSVPRQLPLSRRIDQLAPRSSQRSRQVSGRYSPITEDVETTIDQR